MDCLREIKGTEHEEILFPAKDPSTERFLREWRRMAYTGEFEPEGEGA